MASDLELAALSDRVRGGPASISGADPYVADEWVPPEMADGWQMIDQSNLVSGHEGSEHGYFAAAFRNRDTGEIVIANRGSRLSMPGIKEDWAGTDAKITFGVKPETFDEAESFARQVKINNPNSKITFTGHSKGGAEAQYQAAVFGDKAVTFGAPGISNAAGALSPTQREQARPNIKNYALPGDPVPAFGEHLGSNVMLEPKGMVALKFAATIAAGTVGGWLGGGFGALGVALGAVLGSKLAGIIGVHPMANYGLTMAAIPRVGGISGAGSGAGGGKPQARIADMHVCPMVTGTVPHVGGPIVVGCVTVLVGKRPAARIGDMATCVGPPDAIASGSATVIIGKKPAARLSDMTAHGGVITTGMPTVLTGG